jgi:polar amino acid transport system substrate-binding protein
MSIRVAMMKVTAILIATILSVTSVSAANEDAPVLKRIESTKTIRVGMTGSQPPFNMKNRDGELIGFDVDLARLLARAMRVELEIVEMPFAKLLPALEDKEIDIVMSGVTATLERNTRVPFVGPYYISGKSILTKSDVLSSVQSAQEMNNERLSIAALRGSTSEDFVEAVLDKPSLTTTATHAEAIQLLLDGKVDAVVADGPVCALGVLRNPGKGLVTLNNPLTIEPIGIAIAPGDPLLVNLLQNYMTALDGTGALQKLQKRWFQSGAWLAQVP